MAHRISRGAKNPTWWLWNQERLLNCTKNKHCCPHSWGRCRWAQAPALELPTLMPSGSCVTLWPLTSKDPCGAFSRLPGCSLHTASRLLSTVTLAARESGKHVSDLLCEETWAHKKGNPPNMGGNIKMLGTNNYKSNNNDIDNNS